MRRHSPAGRAAEAITWAVPLALLLLVALVPYIWMLLASLKPRAAIFANPPSFTFSPTWENYQTILEDKGFGGYLMNSIYVGAFSTILAVTIGTLTAYAFARFRMPAKHHLFFWILSTRLGSPVAYALPMYLIFYRMGLLNSMAAIVIAHASFNLVLVVWMMRSFFEDVPREVEEAAELDGCTPFGVFFRISLPMAWPGLATVMIFVLLFSWNELLFALILTSGEHRTITVMIPTLVSQTSTLWGQVAAASVLQSIPVIVFTFFVQKHLVQGLTFGAVKG
ncbi:carbohydrate ABC transporter permease [Methyloligella sp. 2.7D]|uniref:carbohydrate ABC transporter permease n=1 Tax=unclassified Methyloligella TaxID=2625955 RepID=UPI00157D5F0A|nr:carbohydrate ABC transporter permease [Methyloligella sp. GL2]QKP75996.1 carbohydrate ABC transporter permease [Methyloligella sp. GL2]